MRFGISDRVGLPVPDENLSVDAVEPEIEEQGDHGRGNTEKNKEFHGIQKARIKIVLTTGPIRYISQTRCRFDPHKFCNIVRGNFAVAVWMTDR